MKFTLLLVAGLLATSLSATLPAVLGYPRHECSEGWALIDRTCFLLSEESGSWEAGKAFCNERGATLATISSQAQQDTITAMGSEGFWIGLSDLKVEGEFVWADNSDSIYTRWHEHDPNNYLNKEHCVDLRRGYNYYWFDAACDISWQFLCSKPPVLVITPTSTATTTTSTPGPVCEEGWEMFEDTICYKVSDGVASWPRAREACLAEYAQLAAVTSEGQQNFLAARLTGNTWIGLNDEVEEGTFTWSDGTELRYTNWIEDEPNNRFICTNQGVGEDCVEMRHQYGYMWNDSLCHIQKQFVCQKPPSKS